MANPDISTYDCEDGFGAAQMAESYLVIKKIADESAINPNLVALIGSNWNQIKRELIAMHGIVSAVRQATRHG